MQGLLAPLLLLVSLTQGDTLSREERFAGLARLWSEVKFNFVYFDHTDADWDRLFTEAIAKVEKTPKTYDYYRVLQALCARLNDGHTNVYLPEPLRKSRFGARPPIRTEFLDGRVIVNAVGKDAGGIQKGDELVAIDGEPVKAYAERTIAPYQSCATPQDRLVRLYRYQLLNGPPDSRVRLTIKERGDVTLTRVLPQPSAAPGYTFTLNGSVAVVKINDFEHADYVERLKGDLKAHPETTALLFDVRSNGGGNSFYAQMIVSGLIDQPVAMQPSQVRVGRAPLAFRDLNPWQISPATSWKFQGKVGVLTGPMTFSAAEDFVSMFVGAKRGPVIGEATAGSTGQPFSFGLPGGGSARVCAKRDRLPDGREFVGKGIEPDIVVRYTIDDIRQGRDPVLERGLKEMAPAHSQH